MVTVQFYLYDVVNKVAITGVEISLDGLPRFTNDIGIAQFDNIAQGQHSYEILLTEYTLIEAYDPFNRPLNLSGTFTIEWLPNPEYPWPEDQIWFTYFNMQQAVTPPPPELPAILPLLGMLGLVYVLPKKG